MVAVLARARAAAVRWIAVMAGETAVSSVIDNTIFCCGDRATGNELSREMIGPAFSDVVLRIEDDCDLS